MSEAELVERARAGDTDAFGELVDLHQAAVYRVVRAALGSPEDADDVTQDAFLAAFRKIGEFRGDAGFKTWILSIAWNAARMHRRSAWRWLDRFTASGSPNAWDPPAAGGSQQDALIRRNLRALVQRTVTTLPRKFRDVMLLAAAAEHTTEEIAVILGIPAGTVKWRMSEGRRQLKTKLTRLGVRDE